ncbi:hypothetical protein [Rhodococcus sp. JVH1]|uniref:hypothetical protein n=1 Tax=Rhodococcus sp. JVH1 TaxID=745408 RepID=UPI00027212C3|nr:hypothetical protein [Rhodococcus sp. JVH1]EJI98411.1 hypothetical protein JVH1_4279 [Rhodococcus sp. JVH1]
MVRDQLRIGVPKKVAEDLYELGFDQPVETSRDTEHTLETIRVYVEVSGAVISSLDSFSTVLVNLGELPDLCSAIAGWVKREGEIAQGGSESPESNQKGLHFSVTLSKPSATSESGRVKFDDVTSTTEHEFVTHLLGAFRKHVAEAR